MATLIRNSFCLNTYPYSYPSAVSPPVLPSSHYHNHDSKKARTCCPCISNSSSRSRRNFLQNYDSGNSIMNSLSGNKHNIIHGYHHIHHQVPRASKRAHNEDKDYDKDEEDYTEEQQWLREEQRWLREEQRWVREEARWNSERNSLLQQISHLSLKIQDLESELERLRNRVGSSSSATETLSKIVSLLQVLNTYTTGISTSTMNPNKNQIPEYSGEINPLVLEQIKTELETQKPIPSADMTSTPTPSPTPNPTSTPSSENKNNVGHELGSRKKQRSSSLSLKMGSEGDEVQALQEALLNLGFYSGEEDMEYCSFSTGTHRAVQTWQASIGVPEDGIMTAQLLERLYATQQGHKSGSSLDADANMSIPKYDEANGAPTAFVSEQQTIVKKGTADVETSQHRVYLLGENRWEEPSRLRKGNDEAANVATVATKCLTCRGEGRLLCMECDGTGEPNVEEQFLEWVEHELKCPYCEGLGYNICDVCNGKAVV